MGAPAKPQRPRPTQSARAKLLRRLPGGKRVWRRVILGLACVPLLPVLLVVPLRWIDPPTTAFILRDSADPPRQHRRQWVPYEEISPYLPIAVVAAEDQKFPLHYGFDFESISKALDGDGGRPRGASTISQQLAKNLYLWPGRSLLRKGIEAYFTVLIELSWPKRRILEVYLNVVEFGPGIFGCHQASQAHFGIAPAQLTRRQAALLAAVLPDPKDRSAAQPSAFVSRRATAIEGQIRALGGPGYLEQAGSEE